MKTVTICGSMKFEDKMKQIALELETKHNMNVLQCTYNPQMVELLENEKESLVAAHYEKINISDAIFVVDINGYIGESTYNEIEYAEKCGKEIIYYSQLKIL